MAETGVSSSRHGGSEALISALQNIVSRRHVLISAEATRPFRTGFRSDTGEAAIVVRPGSLIEQWEALRICVGFGAVIIVQAANTGLTGGSTPDGDGYDRPIVIINTMRISGIHLIDEGRQVICLAGSTLFELERVLAPLGREPHSVIGSSCIGASVIGGVCNNSGGALVRRGPAYTEQALYARINADGSIALINHLGVHLPEDPVSMLECLEAGDFSDRDVLTRSGRRASDDRYAEHVRAIDAATPARFNADPERLFEASGCAGKVMVFAVRLDTFSADQSEATFYIGTTESNALETIRRDMLGEFRELPISGEYIHRDAFDLAAVYGKDIFLAIKFLGTQRLSAIYRLKARVDRIAHLLRVLPAHFADRTSQFLASLFPNHLPRRMREFRDKFEHHLILKVSGRGIGETRDYLAKLASAGSADFFECTQDEASRAFLHRFAVAGAAVRYRNLRGEQVGDIVALDIALRRNERDWFEKLPDQIASQLDQRIYYGHFFCHVLHQDYVLAKGCDPKSVKEEILRLLDERGVEYPAEHNVGHTYRAKSALVHHYEALDPCNVFNPGIGQTSKFAASRASNGCELKTKRGSKAEMA